MYVGTEVGHLELELSVFGHFSSFRFSVKALLEAPGKVSERKSVYIVLDLSWGRTLNV